MISTLKEVREALDDERYVSKYSHIIECISKLDALIAQEKAEPVVRYCPDCGLIGDVPATARDCCPDGMHARMVPVNFAKSCQDTFMRAIAPQQPAPSTSPATLPVNWAAMIHYPECWDTAAYPELRNAIHEALAWSGCSVCKPEAAPSTSPELKAFQAVTGCATAGEFKAALSAAAWAAPSTSLAEPVGINGLTEAETNASMSVRGLSKPAAPSTSPLTEKMISDAARMLSDRHAAACNVDCGDVWKMYSGDFIEDAKAALQAAHGIGAKP